MRFAYHCYYYPYRFFTYFSLHLSYVFFTIYLLRNFTNFRFDAYFPSLWPTSYYEAFVQDFNILTTISKPIITLSFTYYLVHFVVIISS